MKKIPDGYYPYPFPCILCTRRERAEICSQCQKEIQEKIDRWRDVERVGMEKIIKSL